MKWAFFIFSIILSCNNSLLNKGELSFLSGEYFIQTGGAAGMGPIETFSIFLKKNTSSDSIQIDSIQTSLGVGKMFSFRSIKDSIQINANVYGPLEMDVNKSAPKNTPEIPKDKILLFYKCNQKPKILVLNKSQLTELEQHHNN